MRKNAHGRILREESKEQHLSMYLSLAQKLFYCHRAKSRASKVRINHISKRNEKFQCSKVRKREIDQNFTALRPDVSDCAKF